MKKESRERKFSAFLFLFSIKIITFAGDLARTVKSDKNRNAEKLADVSLNNNQNGRLSRGEQ